MPFNAGYFNCPPSLFQSLLQPPLQPPLMKTTVELEKYFGTGKLSSVRAAMKDDIVFEVLGSDEILIKTKAFVERTRNDRAQEKDKVEVDSPRATMAPRLTELMEHFTMQLVNMYPNPIPLSDVGIFYSRHYGAEVNPERLYAKHWSDLFATTFSSRTMVKDGSIHLREAYVKKHNIKPKHVDQSHAKAGNLQLAMINDLNESSLESGDESEEEEEDKCDEMIAETGVSLTSIPLEPAPMDLISAIPLPPEPKPTLVLQTQRSSTVNAFLKFKCMERGQHKQKITVEVAGPKASMLEIPEPAKAKAQEPPKAKMPETPEPPKANAQDPPFRLRMIDRIKKPNQIKKEPENQRPETPVMPTVAAKNTSPQPQKKTESKSKETPKKAEKNQTKKPVQMVVDQELSNMASCFARLAVTPTQALSATRPTVPAKPKERKGATVKFDPVDDVKRRCVEKMALMAEMKHEGTIRTHASIAASVLPQRTRRPMLLSKVTEKSYP
ncbi:unnamed protein product, partial [Mesorhabditis belari]|uniref:Uncharacterized protein n=1 Tax=Mesorhabditis belari TaxID=2138241 RepID=A0AAF3EIS9_9BILA